MSVSAIGRERVELSTRSAVLAAGDLVAILLFVGAGELQHGYNPVVDTGRYAGTLAPFLVGWVLAATLVGAYRADVLSNPFRLVGLTVGGWVVAVVIAQALRATALFHGGAALTFALVSIGVGGVLLTLWRVVALLLLR
ncbi:DUF3054 domain-containing protein [Haloarcula litorea]|uniref:DUF3054 domain-containing protein n=1 Tax=Haloarcula litorea TaxID=3032579 RepID=UPI0023E811FD|nr:DUF3054 domain-containing protein [Halomicroarcula sp. GDY20]